MTTPELSRLKIAMGRLADDQMGGVAAMRRFAHEALLEPREGCDRCALPGGEHSHWCSKSAAFAPDRAGETPEGWPDEASDAIVAAFIAGATAVHDAWIDGLGDREADFTEAAHDYAAGVAPPVPADSSGQPGMDAPSPTLEAVRELVAERRRQIEVEGWTPDHDATHSDGALAMAAASYALEAARVSKGAPPASWPFDEAWWKPKDRRSNLIRAGALIIAEIERLGAPIGGRRRCRGEAGKS